MNDPARHASDGQHQRRLCHINRVGRPNAGRSTSYDLDDPDLADQFVTELAADLQDPDSCPPEINTLGRTLVRWHAQIVAWHIARVSNGPTEAANNLIKRIKRIAFRFRRFRNYRIRALLYAGKPKCDLLATITPR